VIVEERFCGGKSIGVQQRYVKMLLEVPAFAVSGEFEERNERGMKEQNKGL
jgi:hypothetical protein